MNSKWKLFFVGTLLAAVGLGAFIAGCSRPPQAEKPTAPAPEKTLYTCGMHPWIIQDDPGNCPICGMKLEPVRKQSSGATASTAITVDPATIQLMNIQTTEVTRGPLRRTIRTVGMIGYNETALTDVTTKFKGWIEKLDVDVTGELVHRGEPMGREKTYEAVTEKAIVRSADGTMRFMIDGDLHSTEGEVELSVGPRVKIVVGT